MDARSRETTTLLRSWQFWLLAAVIVGLAAVHQSNVVTDPQFHQVLDVVPYLPIILGALWFGLAGGVTCALLTSACFLTHLVLHAQEHAFHGHNLYRLLNIALFNVVGIVTGALTRRQFRLLERYRRTAEELERSYEELQEKTEALIRSEKELSRANRLSALGELTAGLAHEIGNPLGAIKGAAEIIAEGVDPSDRRGKFSQVLLREVDRLDGVVRSFLSYARRGSGPNGEVPVADGSSVLQDVATLLGPQAERAGLALETFAEPGLPPVPLPPRLLHQILVNLGLNAVQATLPGGVVRLTARTDRADLVFCVEDTGPGIPEEIRARVFEPFFTTREEGTGLGLAIAQRIISGYGGRIELESHSPEGARFCVRIPLESSGGH